MRKQRTQVGRLSVSLRLALLLVLGTLVLLPPVASQPVLSITVSTDKTQYLPGDTVTISGAIRDNQSNPVSGAVVSIQVNDPGNSAIHVQLGFSDQSGAYADVLNLPVNSAQGQYTIYASASKAGYGNGQSHAQFSVLIQTTTSTSTMSSTTTASLTSHSTTSSSTQTKTAGQCLIATATYGSELALEVTLLRNFRDFDVLRTSAGESFMRVFNAFYYSFSPGVASFIASHNSIRVGMKIALYPLIGILYVSSLVFAANLYNTEIAVSVAGVLASFGIGAVYLGPIMTILFRFFKLRPPSQCFRALRLSLVLGIASLVGMSLAECGQLALLMEVSTVCLVLSSIALGGLSVPWTIVRLWSDKHL